MNSSFSVVFAATALAFVVAAIAGGHECATRTGTEIAPESVTPFLGELERRGYLGVVAEELGPTGRPLITEVAEDSPADDAGFEVGDELLSIEGYELDARTLDDTARDDVRDRVLPGALISYGIVREGRPVELRALLAQPPDAVIAQWAGEAALSAAERVVQ